LATDKCVVRALSHGRIRVLVKEHQRQVVLLVRRHTKTIEKNQLRLGLIWILWALSLKRSFNCILSQFNWV
jgi:hypothetical protein